MRGDGAEQPIDGVAGMDQRHDHELEFRLPSRLRIRVEQHMADCSLRDDAAKQGGDAVAVLDVPKAQKIAAAKLAAELLADLGAGEPEAKGRSVAFGDESIRQQRGDLGRLDLEPAWGDAAVAHALPIRIKLLTRRMLHIPPVRQTLTSGGLALPRDHCEEVNGPASGHLARC